MPLYIVRNGQKVAISKAAEAGGKQTIDAALQSASGREFTDAAADLLGPLTDQYDGPATGANGAVLKADAEAWLAARDEEE